MNYNILNRSQLSDPESHDYPSKRKLHSFDFTYFLETFLGDDISTKYTNCINTEES